MPIISRSLFPYMFASKAAHYNLYVDENRDTSPEGEKRLETAMDEAQKRRRQLLWILSEDIRNIAYPAN